MRCSSDEQINDDRSHANVGCRCISQSDGWQQQWRPTVVGPGFCVEQIWGCSTARRNEVLEIWNDETVLWRANESTSLPSYWRFWRSPNPRRGPGEVPITSRFSCTRLTGNVRIYDLQVVFFFLFPTLIEFFFLEQWSPCHRSLHALYILHCNVVGLWIFRLELNTPSTWLRHDSTIYGLYFVCLQCKNCVIHAWALRRWVSYDGTPYKSLYVYLLAFYLNFKFFVGVAVFSPFTFPKYTPPTGHSL